MAKSILDRLKEGDFLTADYVRTYGLIESASFNRLFELEPRLSMSATDAGVLSLGNESVKLTSTQGAKNLYVALNYYYESARTA